MLTCLHLTEKVCHTLTLHTTFTPYNPHKSTNLAFWHLNKFLLFWRLVSHNSSSLLTRSLNQMRMSCERLAQWLTLSRHHWQIEQITCNQSLWELAEVVWLSAYDSVHTTQWPTRLKNPILSWLVARWNPSQRKEASFPPTLTFVFNGQDAQQRDSQGWADYRMRESKLPLLPLAQTTTTTTAVNHRSLQPAHSTRLP